MAALAPRLWLRRGLSVLYLCSRCVCAQGDLLKSGRNKDAIAARLAEANKRLHDED